MPPHVTKRFFQKRQNSQISRAKHDTQTNTTLRNQDMDRKLGRLLNIDPDLNNQLMSIWC